MKARLFRVCATILLCIPTVCCAAADRILLTSAQANQKYTGVVLFPTSEMR